MKKIKIFLIFCLFISIPAFSGAQNSDEILRIPIPGRIEGRGTYFEVKDSDYLNITLESEKEIEVVLESIPRMISLNIASSTEATTTLTIKGLEPNKKYFKYEDSYKNGVEFKTDESGTFSWQQEITQSHHIWFQEKESTIHIPENCTSTLGTWDEANKICTLDKDVMEPVEITTSSLTLNCEGHKIESTSLQSGYGILISNKKNVTIKNCEIRNFSVGIELLGSTDNFLEENIVSQNYLGIELYLSSDNTLKNNRAENNHYGIHLHLSSNNNLRNNRMENNDFNFSIYVWSGIYSEQIVGEINDVDDSNTVNGKPIYYWVNKHDLTIPTNGGSVILVNCSNITVKGLEIKNNSHGILLINTSSSTITENNLENNLNGLVLSFNSNNNQIIGNRINKNSSGLEIHKSSGNLVRKNKIANNGSFTTGGYGIFLYVSSGNALIENEILNNNISTSTIGLLLLYSDSNRIYHNNFINNSRQISSDGWPNSFDNGYPSGGNYWSDYDTPEEGCVDGDKNGFCDEPYKFSGGQDNYPFVKENGWEIPKILISEVYYNPDSSHGATGTNEWMNEWVELRNLDDKEIDISGWTISDNYGTTTIPKSPPIPPRGFTIITPTTSTFDFWPEIPGGTIKIVLNRKIGNGLSNEADKIVLRDKDGKIVDSLCYGNEKDCEDFSYFCKISNKQGYSLEKKPFVLKQNTDFCSFFEQENPNPGKNALDFYWHKEIEDPEDSKEGYEILSAQVVKDNDEILKFLPPPPLGEGLCKTLVAKLELKEILNQEDYSEISNQKGYGGVGMKIETGSKIYLFAFDFSNSFEFQQFLFVSEDNGKNWQAASSDGFMIYPFENNIIFALNMEKLPPLPWKLSFISGFVYENLSNYEILDQTEEISIERENQLPIPIINFSPKNPVKGVKVKFDASSSTDPDGEIINFEWQIGTSTFIGTTTEFTFNENGEYQITLIATDNDGATSSASTTIKVEPFSFAIITDLHIGRGYPDYDGPGFDDGYNGEEYYLTQRLRNVVNWIIQNKDNVQCENTTCSIKFLVVLGDIADSGEKSEFLKAKEILDELNNHGISYVPVFGNHDVWPKTDLGERANSPLGVNYFEEVFFNENATNTRLLKEKLNLTKEDFQYKNYLFKFGGINFIVLDFVTRKDVGKATFHEQTMDWLKEKLNEFQGKEPIILFSHHPLTEERSRKFQEIEIIPFPGTNFSKEDIQYLSKIFEDYESLSEGKQILGAFGGHVHGYYPQEIFVFKIPELNWFFDANWEYPSLSTTPVLTTEALMVGSNREDEYLRKVNKGIIRIVRILDNQTINFVEIEGKYDPDSGTGEDFIALNPYISRGYTIPLPNTSSCFFFKAHAFTKRDVSFIWDFGDNTTSSQAWVPLKCYENPGIYNVKLTLKDNKTGKEEFITRIISAKKEGFVSKTLKLADSTLEKVKIISREFSEDLKEIMKRVGNIALDFQDQILFQFETTHSEKVFVPVANITVYFEKAKGDIDLSNLKIDSDPHRGKTLFYSSKWPEEIEKEKILFVPK
jgi:parallel beta-helix repeat protein